jgi:hypothetical protein
MSITANGKGYFEGLMHLTAKFLVLATVCYSTEIYAAQPFQLSAYHIYVGTQLAWNDMHMHGNHPNMQYIQPVRNLGRFQVTSASSAMQAGLSVGLTWHTQQTWFSSFRFGLQGFGTMSNVQAKGLWTYTLHLPANHYHYSYAVHSSGYGAQLSMNLFQKHHWALFMGAGLGLDWLKSSTFKAVPIDGADQPSFHFVGATKRNIYYGLQVGCHYYMHRSAWGISYLYRNLGYVNSGMGVTALNVKAPAVNDHLQSHGIQISYTLFM